MKKQFLTITMAQQIAEENIRRRISQSEKLAAYQFAPAVLESDGEYFWTFASGSEQLQQEGVVPGALHACVDKVDGHVWTNQEMEEFFSDKQPHKLIRREQAAA